MRKELFLSSGRVVSLRQILECDTVCIHTCVLQEAAVCDGAEGQDGVLLLDRVGLVGRQDPSSEASGVGRRGRHHHPAQEVLARR